MRKLAYILLVFVSVVACKNHEEKNTNEVSKGDPVDAPAKGGIYKMFKGEFIYVADSAVLKTNNEMYAVILDDNLQELADRVAKVKQDIYDMVPVTIRGELVANPLFVETGEGWRTAIKIIEIVNVSDKPAPADLKIGENTKE